MYLFTTQSRIVFLQNTIKELGLVEVSNRITQKR